MGQELRWESFLHGAVNDFASSFLNGTGFRLVWPSFSASRHRLLCYCRRQQGVEELSKVFARVVRLRSLKESLYLHVGDV